jgi:sugar-specific transcriptional regulator TrmB
MSTDPPDDPQQSAIEQLEQFGLSTYAARTFVALLSLGFGTARGVSRVSEVPRTRVYGAVDELRDRGLVDVRESSPKQFYAVSPETATRTFEREYQHRRATLRSALAELEPTERRAEQRGVWTVDGRAAVTERVLEFFGDADEEIVYVTVGALLAEPLVEELATAADRGVSIKLAGLSADVEDLIRDKIPSVTTFESLWERSDTPTGRLLLIDERKTLVSVLVTDPDADSAGSRSETAIWGEGEYNSLVVVLRAMFT